MHLSNFGGLQVVIAHHAPWQTKVIGAHIYWAHPIIQWLARWLPITPYVTLPMTKRWRNAYRVGNTLYIPPEMKAELLRATGDTNAI